MSEHQQATITEAVIYCRVSTSPQATSGSSLSYQLEDCLDYCQRAGLIVAGAFSEIGTGDARSAKRLPARHQAVTMANKRGAFIVCTLSDRFSREMPVDCPYWDLITDGRLICVWDRQRQETTDSLPWRLSRR
ncbi:recombinase family protein [Aporhodopirellula aestuarii]|uniref:Recombinase family protein n=1 Tax=Aporhodopirellula aestuarii TaxID=2950107 RepID=A0ABT0TYI5_9BACT|nr:recombinase family protein [Aporhodopirellula aestuarii]MCM2369658.1 recombinase family protein [Aporhodopirellula aestuarii]